MMANNDGTHFGDSARDDDHFGDGEISLPSDFTTRAGWPGPGNDDSWKKLDRIFIILLQIQGGAEGIYSLRLPMGGGQHTNTGRSHDSMSAVLLFEKEDDAVRYGGMLEDSNTAPRVQECDPIEIELFLLDKANFDFTFIPSGTTLMPPLENTFE
eukprot:CAMPEP_0179481244 /NCGR_PEP_ID=MMETSP0799-20121207/59029_1 /TAXON_ID=46947 /ORGANISM="Geminigera cryophila, Strain CCMP2564" /LENGTH=154 /DNA_ID=CAMNT_0021293771 /DNA_START=1 /DNA_END=465 /DNA_ORIENTATION=-